MYSKGVMQNYLEIVGKVRIHKVDTLERECDGPPLIKCYETTVSSSTINTTSKGSSEFYIYRTA